MKNAVLLAVLLLAMAGTAFGQEPKPAEQGKATQKPGAGKTEWKGVACVSSIDRFTLIHIPNLLASKGIEGQITDGSVVLGVNVPKQDADRATRLLREDAKKRGYAIWFGKDDDQKEADGTTTQIRLPIAKVLTRPEFAKDKPLGRFLRSKELSAELHECPFVESLQIRKREYLATKDKTEIGYEVEIVLYPKANDHSKGCNTRYQVWDQGKQVEDLGGSEWGLESLDPFK